MDCVGHIHLADVPGRHEPGTGEINYRNVLGAARRAGYSGYLGLECIPSKSDVKAALAPIRKIVEEVNAEGT
jgi:hydroxypyruvate isomerase